MINDHFISVRLPFVLADQAIHVATDQGITLSAFLREAIARNMRFYVEQKQELVARRV